MIKTSRNVFLEAASLDSLTLELLSEKKNLKRENKPFECLQTQRMILHILTDCSTPEWTDTTGGKVFSFIIWVD